MSSEIRFTPPLDLPPPKDYEAEWEMLRLAEIFNVVRTHHTWEELRIAIVKEIDKRIENAKAC